MMISRKKTTLILQTVLFLALFTRGDAIECYKCNSILDDNCDKLNDNTNKSYLTTCENNILGKRPFCRKTTFRIVDEVEVTRTIRACGYEIWKAEVPNCYNFDTDFKFETVCQCFTDACNGASNLTKFMLLPLVILINFIKNIFIQ